MNRYEWMLILSLYKYHEKSKLLLSEFFRIKLKFSQSNVFIWTFCMQKKNENWIETKFKSFINLITKTLKKKKENASYC